MEEEYEEEEVWALVRERKDDVRPKHASSSRKHSSVSRKSAPVNIPDWSKIYRRRGVVNDGDGTGGKEEEEEEEEEDKVPPHEWIAKKLARSQISSSSVCEGAGRTLKGRDQRQVRNAVLTKTGFLE
ncbi:hypothetical protein AXF42_Ash019691 [Apostasia shenzhenica]|uniref:Uncharacterized protein n=1 Tax=Apostasia shenzhenica TaxID=1088818 RepID=A0A2H9ZTU7_9ASPA|nr:hypothetical protein AXF42_Ash019691 [Apostasia shenzhenica]